MSVFGIIILLLFIFIIWPIVRVAGAISKARRQFYDRQEVFRQAYGANTQNNNSAAMMVSMLSLRRSPLLHPIPKPRRTAMRRSDIP